MGRETRKSDGRERSQSICAMSSGWKPTQGEELHASLFEKYSGNTSAVSTRSGSGKKKMVGNATTRGAVLRSQGYRLTCYLNADGVGMSSIGGVGGHSTIVKLPMACDTFEEVLIKIQQALHLDKRMLFASELWRLDGTPVNDYKSIQQAAEADVPLVVGCGEPFDSSNKPQDLVQILNEGGGRKGSTKLLKDIREKRVAALKEKAEKVRSEGHGTDAKAVATARLQTTEQNREQVHEMRHRYMESLLIRAAMQQDLMSTVKSNMAYQQLEKAESKARQEEQRAARLEELANERKAQKEQAHMSKVLRLERARAKADRVRSSTARTSPNKSRNVGRPSQLAHERVIGLQNVGGKVEKVHGSGVA